MLESIPRYANAHVVELLEKWLAKAKNGEVNHVAIVNCLPPNLVSWDAAGLIECEASSVFGLGELQKLIQHNKAKRAGDYKLDKTLGADFVAYNFATDPVGFDFMNWLIDAEMTRRREGAPFPLKVGFAIGADGTTGFETEANQRMVNGVILPLLNMFGAVEDSRAMSGRRKEIFTLRDVTKAARDGEPVPHPKPSSWAVSKVAAFIKGSSPITITLREADHWPHRNSDVEAWCRFATDLSVAGERVIVLRDTAKANEPLAASYFGQTWPLASMDLDVRLALYESAKCNFFVANGPYTLALFGSRPFLKFNPVDGGDRYLPNTPKWWHDWMGIEVGEQFPWQLPTQRIVWERDDYATIARAWDDLKRVM
jgi:hypothetical protein